MTNQLHHHGRWLVGASSSSFSDKQQSAEEFPHPNSMTLDANKNTPEHFPKLGHFTFTKTFVQINVRCSFLLIYWRQLEDKVK